MLGSYPDPTYDTLYAIMIAYDEMRQTQHGGQPQVLTQKAQMFGDTSLAEATWLWMGTSNAFQLVECLAQELLYLPSHTHLLPQDLNPCGDRESLVLVSDSLCVNKRSNVAHDFGSSAWAAITSSARNGLGATDYFENCEVHAARS